MPEKRPILLRTFMKDAGTHAIAVGFPLKVHFAFDAEHVRLAHGWRDRFLDARGTWFVRFTPPAVPLGIDPVNFPAGVPLAVLEDQTSAWPVSGFEESQAAHSDYRFLGSRLNAAGVPTFLYQYSGFDVEDQIRPDQKKGLRRQLKIFRGQGATSAMLWMRPHFGRTLQQNTPLSYT
ncbi:MAG: hypothetical protein GY758_05770, partial [Fuerstiella sp.]|nr:hypothetical protein [Fuerstiella sp.]